MVLAVFIITKKIDFSKLLEFSIFVKMINEMGKNVTPKIIEQKVIFNDSFSNIEIKGIKTFENRYIKPPF
jgi:hypothetical protein